MISGGRIMTLEKSFNKKSVDKKENLAGTAMAIVPVIGFVLFGLIPMLLAIVMAFIEMDNYMFENVKFVGLDNFRYVFFWKDMPNGGKFLMTLKNTVIMAASLPINIVLSLIIAFLLTKDIKCKKLFRSIYFIPFVCSTIAISLVWRQFFIGQTYGILNHMLGKNYKNLIDWLNDPKYFFWCVIVTGIWGGTAFNIVLFGAALTNVNTTYYEAAKVDGAGAFRIFFNITLPAISPTTFYVLVTGFIGALQEFARPQTLLISGMSPNPGPNSQGLTSVYYLFNLLWSNRWCQASAVAWLLAIIILIITAINFTVSKFWVSYD